MDLVEIVVRTEDAFGIEISDAEAVRVTTPREFADLIAKKVALSDKPSCLSQQSFYFLREKFQPHLRFSRYSFRPNSLLEEFVPKQDRQVVWTKLQSEVGVNALPDLARPFWLFSILAASTFLVFSYAVFFVWKNIGGFGLTFVSASAAAIAFGYISAVLSRPTKSYFRRDYRRVGEVARYLIINKPHIFKRNHRMWTQPQILEVVRGIIEDYIYAKDYSDDAHFINDLHLD